MLIILSVNSTFTLCYFIGDVIPWAEGLDYKQDSEEESHSDLKEYSKKSDFNEPGNDDDDTSHVS